MSISMRTAAISVAIVLASLATWPMAVSADTPGCVTRAEFRAVHRGHKMARVHRKWDTRGRLRAKANVRGYRAQVRTYRGCGSRYNVVAASFSKTPWGRWKLSAKSAVWVR